MMRAEFLMGHTAQELAEATNSDLRLVFIYARERDKRLAKMIANEMGKLIGSIMGADENG